MKIWISWNTTGTAKTIQSTSPKPIGSWLRHDCYSKLIEAISLVGSELSWKSSYPTADIIWLQNLDGIILNGRPKGHAKKKVAIMSATEPKPQKITCSQSSDLFTQPKSFVWRNWAHGWYCTAHERCDVQERQLCRSDIREAVEHGANLLRSRDWLLSTLLTFPRRKTRRTVWERKISVK